MFTNQDLRGQTFINRDFRGADFAGALVDGCTFIRCDFRGSCASWLYTASRLLAGDTSAATNRDAPLCRTLTFEDCVLQDPREGVVLDLISPAGEVVPLRSISTSYRASRPKRPDVPDIIHETVFEVDGEGGAGWFAPGDEVAYFAVRRLQKAGWTLAPLSA